MDSNDRNSLFLFKWILITVAIANFLLCREQMLDLWLAEVQKVKMRKNNIIVLGNF